MLHETDFYDEVEQIWGRRWGAEDRHAAGGTRVSTDRKRDPSEFAEEWQYYYSSAAGHADLGRLQASTTRTTRCSKRTACV